MTSDGSRTRLLRRDILRIAGVAGVGSLAGCGSDDDSTDTTDSGSGETRTDSGGTESTDENNGNRGPQYDTLKVAHWWSEGDGLEAIRAVMDAFKEKHPAVPIDEGLFAGGASASLEANIGARIRDGDHPSTWQAWPGRNLLPFTDADLLTDIESSVWSKNGMLDAYPEDVKDLARPAGNYVTVPLNVHRVNALFYNAEVLSDAGVDPTALETPAEFVDALRTVERAGYTGMAHQTALPWSTFQLFETVVLGQTDAETYRSVFVDGAIDANRDALERAVETTQMSLQYIPNDAGSISWTEANEQVIDGEAAFLQQGDWAAKAYIDAGLAYGSEWDCVPFPGTRDDYVLKMDSFPVPVENPSPEATTLWCRFVGTPEAQAIFNSKNGSIPPRTDVSTEPFNAFLQDQIRDYRNSAAQPPSVAHGLATPPAVQSALESAVSSLIAGHAPTVVVHQLSNAYGG